MPDENPLDNQASPEKGAADNDFVINNNTVTDQPEASDNTVSFEPANGQDFSITEQFAQESPEPVDDVMVAPESDLATPESLEVPETEVKSEGAETTDDEFNVEVKTSEPGAEQLSQTVDQAADLNMEASDATIMGTSSETASTAAENSDNGGLTVDDSVKQAEDSPFPSSDTAAKVAAAATASTTYADNPQLATPSAQISIESEKSAKPKKKKVLFGVVLSVIIVLLIGGSALGFQFWYQNPDKVLNDSLIKAANSLDSGVYNATVQYSNNNNLDVSIYGTIGYSASGASSESDISIDYEDTKYEATVYTVNDETGMYIMESSLASILNTINESLSLEAQYPSLFEAANTFISEIDGNWIQMADIEQEGSDLGSSLQTCMAETIVDLRNDKNALNELVNLYSENQVFVIDEELGYQDGKLGYKIKDNPEALKSLIAAIIETDTYKSINECNSAFSLDPEAISTEEIIGDNIGVEIWVDYWTHDLKEVYATTIDENNNSSSIIINPVYDQEPEISAPDSFMTMSELQEKINVLLNAYIEDSSSLYGGQSYYYSD